LSTRASSLEDDPSCALAFAALGRRGEDVLAAGGIDGGGAAAAALAEACDPNRPGGFASCAGNASDVARGIDRYACAAAAAAASDVAPPFAHALRGSGDDIDAIASLACGERDCRRPATAAANFSSLVGGLSPALGDWMKLNATPLDRVRAAACCDDLNGEAADIMNESYCSLQESIVREGYIFAGSPTRIQSTCAERLACVGNVTETLVRMNDLGCEIKQESGDGAKFLYYVNNSSDLGRIVNFVCGGGDCYDEIRVAYETCAQDSTEECTHFAAANCSRSFFVMVDGLSDEGRDVFLGIDSAIMEKISSAAIYFHPTTSVIVCVFILFHVFLFKH